MIKNWMSTSNKTRKRKNQIQNSKSESKRQNTTINEAFKNRIEIEEGPNQSYEKRYLNKGYDYIIGVDEAGRGPLAGPVVVASCTINLKTFKIKDVRDSKKLSEKDRLRIYDEIINDPDIHYEIHSTDNKVIDEINILNATMLSMEKSVEKLKQKIIENHNQQDKNKNLKFFTLIDGNRVPSKINKLEAISIVKGDNKSVSIALASIIAKVTRDKLMMDYDEKWPVYGFGKHKGYCTIAHRSILKQQGPCPIHRMSYNPLSTWFPKKSKGIMDYFKK